MNTVGAKRSDTTNVERVVGANALDLETVFLAVPVSAEVSVACSRQLDDGITDGVACARDVVAVETDVGAGEVEKGSNSEGDGGSVHFEGRRCRME